MCAPACCSYFVFESPLVEILVDWKWRRFVRAAFWREMAFYVLHLCFVIAWNVVASQTAYKKIGTIMGYDVDADGEQIPPEIFLLFLWVWTTLMCGYFAINEARKARDVGAKVYFRNVYSLLDASYILIQVRAISPDLSSPVAFDDLP